MTVIVADLGASNARLAFIKKGRLSAIYQFACGDFKDPYLLFGSFLHGYAPDAKFILAGVPGPVFNEEVSWTNRSWKLNAKKLKTKLNLKQVVLMNDLQVQGSAISSLTSKDLVPLNNKKANKAPKILMNVGTGLGACYIVNGVVCPSEYGQNVLPDNHAIEEKISGNGFKKLYQKLTHRKAPISAVKIAEKCLKKDRMARKTYQLFYNEFARVLMNYALAIKATGGVYFTGGILDEKTLKEMKFHANFCDHPNWGNYYKICP
ncbi:MAG: glucokinase [Alphaproteobacteria bacterium]|nr:glucokinase [Alphaproteobacteria bacterium]